MESSDVEADDGQVLPAMRRPSTMILSDLKRAIGGSLRSTESEKGYGLPVPASSRGMSKASHHHAPMKTLYTPSRNSVQFHASTGADFDAIRPSSVKSAPPGFGQRMSLRRQLDISARLSLTSPTISTSPTSPRSMVPIKASPRHRFAQAPAWSLRYAEFVGCSVAPLPPQPRKSIVMLNPRVKQEVTSQPEDLDSVYFASRDKRLPKKDDFAISERPKRSMARRNAIWSNRHKMQVHAAVGHAATKLFPERMKHMKKWVEKAYGKGILGRRGSEKKLEKNQLEDIVNNLHEKQMPVHKEEIQSLYESFTRYDVDDSGYLDRNEIRQVLCDLGLQPRGSEEKVEVHEILCDADKEGLRHYDFNDFVGIVQTVRLKLRMMQYGELLVIYEEADKDDSKSLSMDEVFTVFDKHLNLTPKTDDERVEVQAIFRTCDADDDGEVNFKEFQEFVQRARAKLMMMRREQELEIAKAFQLNADAIAEFRMDLPHLVELFIRYDRTNLHLVQHADMIGLLIDVGLYPMYSKPGDEKFLEKKVCINAWSKRENDFPYFLKLVHELRRKEKEQVKDELLERFHNYDKHRRGELHFNEVYQILGDFKMLPKSRMEQQAIVSVIERLDTDGSGTFDFEEFQDFFQRLTEQVQHDERAEERRVIMSLGYDEYQLQVLRSTFCDLRPDVNGRINQLGLVQGVNKAREVFEMDELCVREVTRTAQQSPEKQINFQEFAQALQKTIVVKNEDDRAPGKDGSASESLMPSVERDEIDMEPQRKREELATKKNNDLVASIKTKLREKDWSDK